MKRLIVCCDGTWNNPDQEDNGIPSPTNVFKLYNAIADRSSDDTKQLKYYHPGVGGEGGILDSILGGGIGLGISRHICSAYHWLATNYIEGDEIYLFGFSRGAFTVRSLAGFMSRGLLDLGNVDSIESWERVHKAYKLGYRIKNAQREDWAEDGWSFFNGADATEIHFLGVWDTVGSLGVPDDLELLNLLDNPKKWKFHDTDLGNHVRNARHAIAMDEVRSCFTVTRWGNIHNHQGAKEVWFPGVHSDVGGGYSDCDLSHGALLWMMKESSSKGLAFRAEIEDSIKADPLGVMHNSFKGAFAKLRSRPRNMPAMINANTDQFHESAWQRQRVSPIAYPAYHPTKILESNDQISVDIFANTRWNTTNVYLEAGKSYTFSATGTWQDSKDTCDWHGTEGGSLTSGDIVRAGASLWGITETLFKKLSHNNSTDFLFTKRVEEKKWFIMIGAIANDGGPKPNTGAVGNDGSPAPHQYVDLTKHETTPLKIVKSGYLYCFPNDVWSLYDNNRGSIRLTIKCV